MLVSHTNIEDYTGFARFVSRPHARLVASGGGVLGAWPISTRPGSFSTFIDHIKRMVDVVGVDHVAIGTDMAGGRRCSRTGLSGRRSPPLCSIAASHGPTSSRSWARICVASSRRR
jgi:microsomal dipeptidase-like Zn-dependent dipeptidase